MSESFNAWAVRIMRKDGSAGFAIGADSVVASWRSRPQATAFMRELKQHLNTCKLKVVRVKITAEVVEAGP